MAASTSLSPAQRSERARKAAAARNAKLTAAERSQAASNAHLAQAVASVVSRAPELTQTQRAKLAAIFAPGADGRAV
ncbi:hypothetical protein [Actinoplanes sp. HUAS TT8]|uniref:hypothetical protein n=1 Tax=Actinoplanes sp. HUAS TT8 TaxID=3447453 RepID=UPI003F52857B